LPVCGVGEILGESGIADEVGICRHSGNKIHRALDLQMVGPKGERLAADE